MYDELEIVNHILATLGESTTPTLDTAHPAVTQARSVLQSYNKEFQGYGWWFNKELQLKLLPDIDGRVRIPDETLLFQVTQCALEARMPACKARFVKRGKFVYDAYKHTNVINCAMWVDIVTLLDIDDLPASAGSYLKHWSAESAFLSDDGDLGVHQRLAIKTSDAWAMLMKDQIKAMGANALESPFAMRMRAADRSLGGGDRRGLFIGGGL